MQRHGVCGKRRRFCAIRIFCHTFKQTNDFLIPGYFVELEPEDELESTKSCSSITTESPSTYHDFGSGAKTTTSKQSHVWTLSLLSRLSHSNEPIDKLADPATIKPLVAYIRTTKNSRASRILARIIRQDNLHALVTDYSLLNDLFLLISGTEHIW